MHALPQSSYDGAINCVTTWSKFDMHWRGVSLDTLLATARPLPNATHVLARSTTGDTANLPLDDVLGRWAWVAFEVDGGPLPRDHGGPARLLFPHVYFCKSARFVSGSRHSTTTNRTSRHSAWPPGFASALRGARQSSRWARPSVAGRVVSVDGTDSNRHQVSRIVRRLAAAGLRHFTPTPHASTREWLGPVVATVDVSLACKVLSHRERR